jgi:hypothetical protein
LAWKQLLEATDWAGLEGSGDLGPLLQTTPLFQGVLACCGTGAFGYGSSVTDFGHVSEVRSHLAGLTQGSGRTEALVLQAFDLALSQFYSGRDGTAAASDLEMM